MSTNRLRAHRATGIASLVAAALVQPLSADVTDLYVLRLYSPTATQPFTAVTFPAPYARCNQPPPPAGASTVNPDRIVWADPQMPGRMCIAIVLPGSILLPRGEYEATLAVIHTGVTGPESNRALFSSAPPEVPPAIRRRDPLPPGP